MTVKLNLENILIEKEISQIQLSEMTGISRNTISKLAKGQPRQIRLETIDLLCGALGISVSDLFVYQSKERNNGKKS